MDTFGRYLGAAYSACTLHLLRYKEQWILSLVLLVLLVFIGWYLFLPPADFRPGEIVVVPEGMSAPGVADLLAQDHVISHPRILELILRLQGDSALIQPGAYRFMTFQSVGTVAHRLTNGTYDLPLVRITFPEGESVRTMAAQVASAFPGISAEDFESEGLPYEGYLFPDTYVFPPSATTASIIAAMQKNFEDKTALLAASSTSSGHSFSDIVIMASLLEKEARTPTDQRIVAGILWNRLARNMPLQVDAVFGYIYNRDTYSPSFADLSVNSPYNTYIHRGLPPGPINNPGLIALMAAAYPIQSKYLYYLTGSDGTMHYAVTYAQHEANERTYLNQ